MKINEARNILAMKGAVLVLQEHGDLWLALNNLMACAQMYKDTDSRLRESWDEAEAVMKRILPSQGTNS